MKVLLDLSTEIIQDLLTVKFDLEKLGYSPRTSPDSLESTIEWLLEFWGVEGTPALKVPMNYDPDPTPKKSPGEK